MKKIIGLTGSIASGKEVTKKYIEEKYGAKSVKFSQIIRDVLGRLRIPINRKNMQSMAMSLLGTFGDDLLAKNIVKDAEDQDADIVILDGVRRPADIIHATKMGSFSLIAIDVSPEIRYERMKSRNENEGDINKTYEDFLKDHESETEIMIPGLMENADYTLENNGSLEELYEKIDKVISQI